jgi:hypothetical protein
LLGCDLRLPPRDGHKISDRGGALCSAVGKTNLSRQRSHSVVRQVSMLVNALHDI